MAVTCNKEAFFEKASKGSFAARAAWADVYVNNGEIFRSRGYETETGRKVELDPSAMLEGTVVYDSPIIMDEVPTISEPTVTGVANTGSIETLTFEVCCTSN